MKATTFSVLDSYDSLGLCLKKLFHISTNQLKKHGPSAKKLNRAVKKKDVITVSLDVVNCGGINSSYCGPEIETIYEDDAVIILNKPEKVHCHPLSYSENDNCLSFLRSKGITSVLNVNRKAADRGLIHRLDYETSGVLFLVKKDSIYEDIRSSFATLAKQKKYFAVVSGDCNFTGVLEQCFRSVDKRGQRVEVVDDEAESTNIGVMEITKCMYNQDCDVTLLMVDLKTGLRHQIRSGLSAIGHPILGDTLYGGRSAGRVFLHSYLYEIEVGKKIYQGVAEPSTLLRDLFDFDTLL